MKWQKRSADWKSEQTRMKSQIAELQQKLLEVLCGRDTGG